MSRQVGLPPENGFLPDGTRLGGWWHDDPAEEGRIACDLCPRDCHLRPGDRGFCFVRENREGQMVLSTYGRSTGFCIDPIEKKPLNQFYPGTSVLSFGTAGCNLGCKFCQNWSISKSREIEQLSEEASPQTIATAAQKLGCKSVAFTYNDPVIWAEYAIDAARACREAGVKTVAVTAGYITPQARAAFYEHMDAANVDLKGFTEEFYRHLTLSHLQPVLDTLRWLVHESPVWTEITNLIIPRENDSPDELKQMCDWILENLGPKVPVHFTAFHPDFRMNDRERTPAETLLRAHEIAAGRGLNYAYVGNVHSPKQQTTYCPGCKQPLIERVGYTLGLYALEGNKCRHCGHMIAGHFEREPGNWGSRRQPVRISNYEVRRGAAIGVKSGPYASESASEKPVMLTQITSATSPPVMTLQSLTPEHEQAIVRAAARAVQSAARGYDVAISDEDLAGCGQIPVLGVFVSLKRRGRLRSCCGFLGQTVPLSQALAHAAKRAAGDDHRFPPIALRELEALDFEVWRLHNHQPVEVHGAARASAIEIGKHGLQIARGTSRGLLLPGVAVEHGLDAEQFLRHVAMKAELPPTAWREPDTQLSTFEGMALRGALAEHIEHTSDRAPLFPVTREELGRLAEFCRGNVLALLSGATPSYFAFGLPDGNIHGAAISIVDAEGHELLQASRQSMGSSLPLQSTLFNLCENLAQSLSKMRLGPAQLEKTSIHVSVLTSPAMHGSVSEPDLRGFDPAQHFVLVMQRNHSAGMFDPARSADELLEEAAASAQLSATDSSGVFSLAVLTTMPRLKIVHVPQAVAGADVRPPAVAGKFYPDDPEELASLVDQCFSGTHVQPAAWPAVMAPHAGLRFSGRIAADTLRRVIIPPTVIIIGPKHTPYGANWAVAPHKQWSIPGATIASDPQLAAQLVAAIPGLQLDAAAHAHEHGIEVELPLLARLAPRTKVVGIAIGSGDLARCRQFAAGLASVIKTLPQQPLLMISSDMNHFASDAESRRLDNIALEAMESLDPARLYNTVTSQSISMCGVLPAVIVMETLRQLGQLGRAQRVGYATSADVTGDQSRVVGYAGMLLGP